MKNALKKHYIIIILFSLLSLFILLITTIKTKYCAYMPGCISSVSNVVEIDGLDSSSNYYSTSVYYYDKVSLFQKFLYDHLDTVTLYKKSGLPSEIESLQGEIEHNSAISSSIIAAYDLANIELDYKYIGTYVYYTDSKVLNVGDVVLGSNYEDSINNLKNKEIAILRNIDGESKEMSITLNENDKVVLEYAYYEINNDNIKIYPSNNEGPSAGFMQSLKLYDDLVDKDYGTKYKIAGTGTMDEYGNVGAIGCVDLKIYTAMYNNCDIFFVPISNAELAGKTIEKLNTDMQVVYISTLAEAVSFLEGLE